jgi:hypothetical protein
MSGQVYSSKSLLDSIGKIKEQEEVNDLPNDENVAIETDTVDDSSTFLLASTLAKTTISEDSSSNKRHQVPMQEEVHAAVNSHSANFKEESPTNDDESEEEDTESVTSDIVISPSTGPKIMNKGRSKTLDILKILNPSNLLPSHDLLLGAYLEEHKYELLHNKNLIMRVITWNLNQMKPPSLKELAGEAGKEWAALFYAGDETLSEDNKEGLADIYTINFQETISLKSFSKSEIAIDIWVHFILAVLNAISSKEYSLVFKTGLLGLTTIIIAKKSLLADPTHYQEGQIHDIRENHIGLGYLRWGNKGCISARFRVGGVDLGIGNLKDILAKDNNRSINKEYGYHLNELDETIGKLPGVEVQVLNVHLVHGEGDTQIQQRWESWNKIEKKIQLDDRSVRLAIDNSTPRQKDAAQIRLEEKLKSKLHKDHNIDEANFGKALDNEMERLNFQSDSVRTSYVPLRISNIERSKMQGVISEAELQGIEHISESQKVLVVSGDTNYRLNIPPDISSQNTVKQLAKEGIWKDILAHDQLIDEMKKHRIFIGFTEPKISFAPTFKIVNGSNGQWILPTPPHSAEGKRYRRPVPGTEINSIPHYSPRYDPKRIPAYTDRILYVQRPHFQHIDNTYSSISTKGSDHLPVACSYKLEAPLVDEEKLHLLKVNFAKAWDEIINKFVFLELSTMVSVAHTMMGKYENYQTENSVMEGLPSKGGHISVSAIVGETITINLGVTNIIDEAFDMIVTEQSSRGWFGTKINIDCRSKEQPDGHAIFASSMKLESRSDGQVQFALTPTTSEILDRTFSVEIPEYSLCPAYRKYVALNIKVYDFFGTSLDSLSKRQFENIHACFRFIFTCSPVSLLDHTGQLNSTDDFSSKDWDLVREITLWEFDSLKYSQMNEDGLAVMKEGDKSKFNMGSITVMSVVYLWLKSQSSHFNTSSKNGKIIFGDVINLIKYFKMDATEAYNWFGWLFADEYELNSYLDRDFDVKVDL